jgi:excisionase family DNA binding protein
MLESAPMSDERLDSLLEALRPMVAELVADELERLRPAEAGSPYMTVDQAAAYIGNKPQRIYDLCSDGRLRRYKDGSTLLVRRDEIDAYLCDGGRR